MLDRLLWLVAFVALAAAVGWLIKRSVGSIPPTSSDGHKLLYFWGPGCAACTTARQTLVTVTHETPWVQLQPINVIEHPGVARQWRVMTLPTIILLDGTGQIAYRASGSLSLGKLREAITRVQSPSATELP